MEVGHDGRRPGHPARTQPGQHVGPGAAEGRLTGEHLVEHAAEPEHVAAVIDQAAVQLLRRHVAQRAGGVAGVGLVDGDDAGQAEVEDLQASVVAADQVIGLDVEMDDAREMGEGQPGARVLDETQQLAAGRRRPLANQRAEGLARHVLHGDERLVAMLADIEDGDDVLVGEAPGGPRLAGEAIAGHGVEGGAEELDRHHAVDQRIAREVDLAHASTAEELDDFEAADAVELVHRVPRGAPAQGDPGAAWRDPEL